MTPTPKPTKKKPSARAWNADGWLVFHRDGRAEWSGAKTAEEAIADYPEKARRQILAVILKEAMPTGAIPVNTDLAFVVTKTRVLKRQAPIPKHEVRL